jgi:hypothetical protein
MAECPAELSEKPFELCFDTETLEKELRGLSPEVLERFRDSLLGNLSGLPFDLFVSQVMPTGSTGSPDQIVIGFDFTRCPK